MVEFLPVTAPAAAAADAVSRALHASPRGHSFGRLTEAAMWLAACQDAAPARPLEHPKVVVFIGQHGIVSREVSAFAPAANREQAAQLADGVSPAHVVARRAGATVDTVLTGASGSIDVEDALTEEQLDAAVELGRAAADSAIDAGADLLIPADLGVGNTTVAAAVMGRLTRTEPVAIIGPGSGITDNLWKNKVAVIRDAMFRARGLTEPLDLIRVCGGQDLAALVGFIAQAAARRTPLLIDSPLTAVATVLAERLARGTAAWVYAASATDEPAHRLALADLGLLPLLEAHLSTGQGVGSLAALELMSTGIELAADEYAAFQVLNQAQPHDDAAAERDTA